MDGELAGGMSKEELMPGSSSGGGSDDLGMDGGNDLGMGDGDDLEMGGDDEFGMDGGGDPFGDGGDGDDDLLDDGMDGGGGNMSIEDIDDGDSGVSSQIESRVNDMENEVGSLASTVNTVQSENENISDSLEEIEENIRKLLEVYEMVTQGVNPFVEDDSLNDSFGGGAPGSGNFGGNSLFDGDDDTPEESDEVDDDIADAEAEEFLDESMIDGEDDGFDDEFDDDGLDDEFSDEGEDQDDFGSADGDDGDLSFDDLKSEYDSGDAEWGEGESESADDDPFESDDDSELADDTANEDDVFEEDTTDDALFDDERDETEPLAETTEATDKSPVDDEPEPVTAEQPSAAWDDGDRPYLESVPSEYNTEFVVMDWLDYLVEEAGLEGAARTVRFYGSVCWVSPSVEEYLQTTLNGFDGGPDIDDPDPRSSLGVDHKRSLWWINQIATPAKKRLEFEEWLETERVSAPQRLNVTGPSSSIPDQDKTSAEAPNEVSYTDPSVDDTDTASEMHTENDDSVSDPSAASPDHDEGQSSTESEAELDNGSAQKIRIDETESNTTNVDDVDDADFDGQPAIAQPSGGGDGERMIWVDSDVVLSDSGVEVRQSRPSYERDERVEYVTSLLQSAELEETTDLEGWQREHVKPLVAPDDDTELERWQVELIRSLFASDEDGAQAR
ncbi:FlaD/FlaE family flagellar protein (plasmid) [Natrialbaceae archaeon A-arb3/5]